MWIVGFLTSSVYVFVFFFSKIYADMGLNLYYVFVSIYGFWQWTRQRKMTHRPFPLEKNVSETQGKEAKLQGTISTQTKTRKATGQAIPTAATKNLETLSKETKAASFIARENTDTKTKARTNTEAKTQTNTEAKADKGAALDKPDSILYQDITWRMAAKIGFILAVLYCILYFILTRYTDSPIPIGDAFTTAVGIVATWMLARRLIAHWLLWIVVNFVSVYLYYLRGLYPTMFLYLCYAILAFIGLYNWKKKGIKTNDSTL